MFARERCHWQRFRNLVFEFLKLLEVSSSILQKVFGEGMLPLADVQKLRRQILENKLAQKRCTCDNRFSALDAIFCCNMSPSARFFLLRVRARVASLKFNGKIISASSFACSSAYTQIKPGSRSDKSLSPQSFHCKPTLIISILAFVPFENVQRE